MLVAGSTFVREGYPIRYPMFERVPIGGRPAAGRATSRRGFNRRLIISTHPNRRQMPKKERAAQAHQPCALRGALPYEREACYFWRSVAWIVSASKAAR